MLALFALVVAAAEPPPRVLVLETRADGPTLEKVRAFGDLLATVLEPRTAAEIVPASSVKDRLAVAAEKVSAGCDDTTCMTEIAGALDARYVVASRASQVGGRWLMRVELFDSRDLKVVAQTSTMSDSVEGLASQAEKLADGLMEKAPMLPRKGEVIASEKPKGPPPDPKSGSPWPWVITGVSSAAVVGIGAGWAWSYSDALGKETAQNNALKDYKADPNVSTRKALVTAASAADGSSTLNNCVFFPLGCFGCLPLAAAAAGAAYWGATQDNEEPKP